MTIDDDELDALAERQMQIREAFKSGESVVMRLHPYYHSRGYAVYAERGAAKIFACSLVAESTCDDPEVVEVGPDPEASVRAWLSREFSDCSLTNVRVERYVEISP